MLAAEFSAAAPAAAWPPMAQQGCQKILSAVKKLFCQQLSVKEYVLQALCSTIPKLLRRLEAKAWILPPFDSL